VSRASDLVTERLTLRRVAHEDLSFASALGADPRVMASFGSVFTGEQSARWLEGQLAHWQQHGFGRFTVLREGAAVGFVGLARTDYDAGFTPGVEIAWRLAFDHWGNGYATEAARAVVREGFERLAFPEIVGVTTPGNTRSRRVMERLGMTYSPADTFDHPLVPEGDPLRRHVVYRLSR
jgi:RimJ/RimL family protein N-acetyltransferase